MKKEYKMKCRNCGKFYGSKTIKHSVCNWCRQERGIISKEKRVELLAECVKDYKQLQHAPPSEELVRKWAVNKFNISRKTAGTYLSTLKKGVKCGKSLIRI
ncbi:MAG: hypothetical protein PHW96_00960 [Candidatus Nanoarchaeia archaeon]|nr:hypothetical protein [Candidatus Nanoarchaeia archaeon]